MDLLKRVFILLFITSVCAFPAIDIVEKGDYLEPRAGTYTQLD